MGEHDTWVYVAKVFGLLWLMAVFIGIVIYAMRPSRKHEFERVGASIIDDNGDDRPQQENV